VGYDDTSGFKLKVKMDIFYNTRELSLLQKIALIKDCKEICFYWWTDKIGLFRIICTAKD
jgi:hypothetical protein